MTCVFNVILYYYLMFLKTLEIRVLKYNPEKCFSPPGLAWQAAFKKAKLKLDLLADIDMLLMVEKGIMRGRCHSFYRYAKAMTNTRNIMIKIKSCNIFNISI